MAPPDNALITSLLSLTHDPSTVQKILTEKLQRPLRLKPTDPSERAPETAQQSRRRSRLNALAARKKKQKPAPLSSRAKRSLGLYQIPPSSQKYDIYVPIHNLWVGYIQEILWDGKEGEFRPINAQMAGKLASADFHGAEVEVVRSKCVGRVGTKGLVVRDSKFTFEIVTKGDSVKIVPKEGTVFRFCVPVVGKNIVDEVKKDGEETDGGKTDKEMVDGEKSGEEKKAESEEGEKKKELIFELHGDQFRYRAADRANRKFKTHFLKNI